jgi:signal peptidase I
VRKALRFAGIGALLVVGACNAIPMATVLGFVYLLVPLNLAHVTREFRIPSSAMEPTLRCARPAPGCGGWSRDRIVTLKYILFGPGRGDIVVFHTPQQVVATCGVGGVFVKRIIGMPGETWQERHGFVYINGEKLSEPYIRPDRRDDLNRGPITIPKDQYFVMGDNRSASCDSRVWGALPRGNIIGKVILTYWPPDRISLH